MSKSTELWRLAWPAVTRNLLNCMSDRLTLGLVGHFGNGNTAEFDGAGVGKMLSNVTGLSIGLGLTLGLSTLCSQSHGRGAARAENGVNLRRCAVTLCLAFVLSGSVAVFAEPILLALAQPAAVARTSARFAQVQTLGVPFSWAACALQTVCDGLQQTKPGMWSMVIAAAVQICLTVAFVVGLGWGYLGMAAAKSICGVLQFALLFAMIKRSPCLENGALVWGSPLTWTAWRENVATRRSILGFVAVALPSAVIWWVEWWSFEGLTVLVGLLPDATNTLAAHTIIFNTIVTLYQIPQGIGTALCAATGARIGAGRPEEVPTLIMICVTASMVLAGGMCTLVMVFSKEVALLFTPDRTVISAVEHNALGAVLSLPGYALLMTLAGACRGINRNRWVAAATTTGYAAGVPLAWYWGFHLGWPRQLMGVWLGNAAALAWAATITVLLTVCGIRWSEIKAVVALPKTGGEAIPEDRQELITAPIYE